MNTKRIAIIDLGYRSYNYEHELFQKNGYELMLYKGDASDRFKKAHFVSDAYGMLVRGTLIDKDFLSLTSNLQAIVRYGVGFENIDLAEATRRNIKVAIVQGYANHAVSDHAIALIYSCARSLSSGSDHIREIFSSPPVEGVFELHDKTIGIIGLGRIGSCFASKVRHLFKEVLAYDPYIEDYKFNEAGALKTDLDTLLRKSHVISLHCNLSEETTNIIDERAFNQMKNKPVLINTARGPVVSEAALVNALNNNLIHSAGIDVFNDEPPTAKQEPLFNHPRVVATGHYAWYSEYSINELQRRAADNLIRLLAGENIKDQLNLHS
ncbi:MAG TPA: NAD(P)-dependent oxidoreductase [Bacteroidales bacterium]|nr:NAD(P)-dependent oxidoreductase [Bacteroidales bacterium]